MHNRLKCAVSGTEIAGYLKKVITEFELTINCEIFKANDFEINIFVFYFLFLRMERQFK